MGHIACFYNVSVVCLVTKRLKSREFASNGPFAVLKINTKKIDFYQNVNFKLSSDHEKQKQIDNNFYENDDAFET